MVRSRDPVASIVALEGPQAAGTVRQLDRSPGAGVEHERVKVDVPKPRIIWASIPEAYKGRGAPNSRRSCDDAMRAAPCGASATTSIPLRLPE